MPDLTVSDLSLDFGSQRALHDVSFTVGDGEFFTLLGPSGCGKSTTLMSIAGLEKPTTGRIAAGDTVFVDTTNHTSLTPEERNLGMVFQTYALWPHMTVAANLEMPLKLRKIDKAERGKRVSAALAQVGLSGFESRYPHQMSGGQQQRIALARAIVYAPAVLLLDEPLSNLDAKLRERARTWLKELQQDVGITTVYVTHDQTEALTLSDRIAVMQEGKMLQIGTPEEIYDHPSSPEVADFIGRCNFFPGSVISADHGQVTVAIEGGGAKLTVATDAEFEVSNTVTLGIRAEHVTVAAAEEHARMDNVMAVRMRKRSFAGSRYEYEVEYGEQRVVVESTSAVSGHDLWLGVPSHSIYLFPGTYTSGVSTSTQARENG